MVMVMTAVSIVISVIVLDLHHHEPTHAVPRWLRSLVFGFMARALFMRSVPSRERHSRSNVRRYHPPTGTVYNPRAYNANDMRASVKRHSREYGYRHVRSPTSLSPPAYKYVTRTDDSAGAHVPPIAEMNGIDAGVAVANTSSRQLIDDLESGTTQNGTSAAAPALEEILTHLRGITVKMKLTVRRDAIKEEWQMLAKVIDRFLLVIFLLAITTLTLAILYIYPQIAMANHTCHT